MIKYFSKNYQKIRLLQIELTGQFADKIIKHKTTSKKYIYDFKNIHEYISNKFPDINVSNVPLYIAKSSVVEKYFPGIGGCYLQYEKCMIVKDHIYKSKTHNKFDAEINSFISEDVDSEDIIVHEMIHAVLHEANSSLRKFKNAEEEFVYTNSIDFYKNKKMSDDDIVKKVFLPFCLNDVMDGPNNLMNIVKKCLCVNEITEHNMPGLLSKHAKLIAKQIYTEAYDMGNSMIALYNQFGRGVAIAPHVESSDRNRCIDFGGLD